MKIYQKLFKEKTRFMSKERFEKLKNKIIIKIRVYYYAKKV